MTQLVRYENKELFFLSSRISADKLGLTNWVVDPEAGVKRIIPLN